MSTTLEREIAMGYAKGDGSRMGIVIEVQQGMVDRGADVEWLSQYPSEREILFAPLTGLEVIGKKVEGQVLVVNVRLNVNMMSQTIEEVIAKMQRSHIQLLDLLTEGLRFAGVPSRAMQPLASLKTMAEPWK